MADLVKSGRAVAPSAAAALVTITAPPAGQYKATIEATVSGNAAGDTDNLKLVVNNADYANPIPCGVSGAAVSSDFTINCDGTHDVVIAVVGAGTASIVYEATMKLALLSENNNEADAELL